MLTNKHRDDSFCLKLTWPLHFTLAPVQQSEGLCLFLVMKGHTLSVSSQGWPRANLEKRGTPAPIISTFTQVKNQTFSFHFFSWVQEGGCCCWAWEYPTWGGQMVYMLVSVLPQICSHVCVCVCETSQTELLRWMQAGHRTAPKDSCARF